MARLLAIALLALFMLPSVVQAQLVWMTDLVVRDGLYYEKFTRTPFTGEVRGRGLIREGKLEGAWIFFDDNGQRLSEGRYEDGIREGPWVFFHPNGQMESRGSFARGAREGRWAWFDDNGNLDPARSGTYRNGERISD